MQFTFTALSALAALASTVVASPIVKRSSSAFTITVKNSCSETVWPGVGQSSSSTGQVSESDAGFELTSGASKTISIPSDWVAGRVFGRTGCSGSGDSFTCEVGDCGAYACGDSTGVSGVTLAEFSYSDMDLIFYNLSLISGYNLGMQIAPSTDTCPTYTCASESCSDSEAYHADSDANPCSGCQVSSDYTIEFCPS